MTLELLIHSIVRQTTILIARLATSGGTRAPLAQVADQVFYHLVKELEEQGVSRKVCADMFGLGLRTYQRKIQRLTRLLLLERHRTSSAVHRAQQRGAGAPKRIPPRARRRMRG
jgi:hypothetical protein